MTDKQLRTIELMKNLGSMGYTKNDGQNVYISLPFAEDRNPNIKVWPDGSWHDFSGNDKKWEQLGLKPHGTLSDLENVVSSRFEKIWASLKSPVVASAQWSYIENRKLTGDIRVYDDSLAFPIKDYDGHICGIQTRRIDNKEPKNKMLHGSNGHEGLFIADGSSIMLPILICEGATDTYTRVNGFNSIGAISVSMLEGVKKWISENQQYVDRFVLAFDADEPGIEAQNKMIAFMTGIGIDRNRILVMKHRVGKDVNDEALAFNGEIEAIPLGNTDTDLFVKITDTIIPEMENALWYGFFPPDFPEMNHTNIIDYKEHLYVFPESFGRSKVNELMWKNKSSAYILRGW